VSPEPAVTPVIVPVPLELHIQAVPFHDKTWLAAQVLRRPSLTLPLVPPPVSPEPAVTASALPFNLRANPTQAYALYRTLGFEVAREYEVWERALDRTSS